MPKRTKTQVAEIIKAYPDKDFDRGALCVVCEKKPHQILEEVETEKHTGKRSKKKPLKWAYFCPECYLSR